MSTNLPKGSGLPSDQLSTDHLLGIQDLTAAGLEVIPYEVLRENDAYKSLGPVLRTKQDPVGTQTGKSVFVGAHGTPYYLLTSEDKHLGVGSMFGALSTTQPQNIEPQIARSLDAAVFRVTLLVAFAEQSTKGGMFRTESSVSTGAGLSIIPDASQYVIVTPSGRARVYLDEGIRVQTDALQLVETTTKSEKAVKKPPANIPANSPLAKVKMGMQRAQVDDLLGPPTSTRVFPSGKAFNPFYYGPDTTRTGAFYKGLGRVVFSGAHQVVEIEYDPTEDGD